jgi:hypothetical protein
LTLECRPPGRGNWRLVVVTIECPADLFRFRPNQRITIGDYTLRIVKVIL